jgi:hypothetical protein
MDLKKIYIKPQISVLTAVSTHGKNVNKVENNGHPNGTGGAAPRS